MLNITTRDQAGVMIIDLEGQIDGGPLSARVHELISRASIRARNGSS